MAAPVNPENYENWEEEFQDCDPSEIKTYDQIYGNRFDQLVEQFGVIFGSQASQFDPPSWLIKNFLVENTVSAIYGAPGTFKSFLALHVALCISTGVSFNGITPSRKGLTIYIAAEGEKGVSLRLAAWLEHYKQTLADDDFWLLPIAVNLLDVESVNSLIELLKEAHERRGARAELVVVDTLAQCTVGADEQSSQAMGQATAAMIRIRRELDTAVIFVHHDGKDASKGMRGSSSIKGNTDAAFYIVREEKAMESKMVTQRQKDVMLAEDVSFGLVNVPVPRLLQAGHENFSSLVVDFNVVGQAAEDEGKKRADLLQMRAIVTAIESGGGAPITINKALMLTYGHKTAHYRERLLKIIPERELIEVRMSDEDESQVRVITKIPGDGTPGNLYGSIMLLPPIKR
jgi:KaiC/GvpD/RAD55 family RecA-like ATPase